MKLLLHACCGPCLIEPGRILADELDAANALDDHADGDGLAVFYFNPNIHPAEEYAHRRDVCREYATAQGWGFLEGEYEPACWNNALDGDTDFPRRCRMCYRIRFEGLARIAAERGFDSIATTLTVSPYQDQRTIKEELGRAAVDHGLTAVYRDFSDRYSEATRISRECGMYRQNYCGCAYSKVEAERERERRRAQRKAEKEAKAAEVVSSIQAAENTKIGNGDGTTMRTDDFSYELPEERIAQTPAIPRDSCKLLVVDRTTGDLEDCVFTDIESYLNPGDLLVVNNTRVLPARLFGVKPDTGGNVEVLLLKELGDSDTWECLVKPAKRIREGQKLSFGEGILTAIVVDAGEAGERTLQFAADGTSVVDAFHRVGQTPLPPYITTRCEDPEMYQTVFSKEEHSAAAPTAGLHFTPELLGRIREKGINTVEVELQVGLDTFRVVEAEDPRDHRIHTERFIVEKDAAEKINATHEKGGRVIAVGTTSVRALESAYDPKTGRVEPQMRDTSLFILPGSTFNVVDALITNFHVPRSSLMMLVSAFATREIIMDAYTHAIEYEYRMLSFGDAMLLH